jgi:hypothetical protein
MSLACFIGFLQHGANQDNQAANTPDVSIVQLLRCTDLTEHLQPILNQTSETSQGGSPPNVRVVHYLWRMILIEYSQSNNQDNNQATSPPNVSIVSCEDLNAC